MLSSYMPNGPKARRANNRSFNKNNGIDSGAPIGALYLSLFNHFRIAPTPLGTNYLELAWDGFASCKRLALPRQC